MYVYKTFLLIFHLVYFKRLDSTSSTSVKMDPFEARLQFSQMMETMSSFSQTILKAINFALKNQDLHEDFHSVVLEILDRLDFNARINVLYFLEALIRYISNSANFKDSRVPYVDNLERDWKLILSKVIGDDLVNLNSCVDVQREVERVLGKQNRDLSKMFDDLTLENLVVKSEESEGFRAAWSFLISKKRQGIRDRLQLIHDPETAHIGDSLSSKPTKEQILKRIENDRERNKRLKETNWVVARPLGKPDIPEFERIWNQYQALDEDDYLQLKELQQVVRESYQVL